MRSFTLFIFLAIFYIINAYDQCMCLCCRGHGCEPKYKPPTFNLSHACTESDCRAACPFRFPLDCAQDDETVDSMCTAPMTTTPAASTSTIFNQYMIFGSLFLSFQIKDD